jgi:molybdopterin/thiamine biosynthesis adenylyltransferase
MMQAIIRAGYAGPDDLRARMPELTPLADKTVVVFGLGCVGAPSALELVRAGVGQVRLVDHDLVDPATVGRWPFGLAAAGHPKVDVLAEFIRREYPYTKSEPHRFRIGAARDETGENEQAFLQRATQGASLIYDATSEFGVQLFLSAFARDAGIPYISATGTNGGWGGEVLRVLPDPASACWGCYCRRYQDATFRAPSANTTEFIQPAGCSDPTFTGAGFDLAHVALFGVRAAVSTLCAGRPGGYPRMDWDLMVISFRDPAGLLIEPRVDCLKLVQHPDCERCKRRL